MQTEVHWRIASRTERSAGDRGWLHGWNAPLLKGRCLWLNEVIYHFQDPYHDLTVAGVNRLNR